MDENNTDAIYEFGKDIVIDARDGVIEVMKNILEKEPIDKIGKKIFEEVRKLNLDEQKKKMIILLISRGIDTMMHALFVNFDESFGKYRIVTKDKNGNDFNIVTESDGLPYGYYEFIDEFSKYKSACDISDEDISEENWKLEKDPN